MAIVAFNHFGRSLRLNYKWMYRIAYGQGMPCPYYKYFVLREMFLDIYFVFGGADFFIP
jgi:hypothetical protein